MTPNLRSVLTALMGITVAALLLLPTAALFLHLPAGTWATAWREGRAALGVSAAATLAALACIVILGTPLAWLLARRQGRFWRVVEVLLLIPLAMPPLVIGLLLVDLLGPYTLFGRLLNDFGLSGSNSLIAVVVAQIYEALPFYVFAAQAAFSQVDPRMEQTAFSLGANPLRAFRLVTLPGALPGLTVGFAMAFARAIGAFGAVIVVAYHPETLPVRIWIALQEQGLPTALPLSLLLLLVSLPLPLMAVVWRRVRLVAV